MSLQDTIAAFRSDVVQHSSHENTLYFALQRACLEAIPAATTVQRGALTYAAEMAERVGRHLQDSDGVPAVDVSYWDECAERVAQLADLGWSDKRSAEMELERERHRGFFRNLRPVP